MRVTMLRLCGTEVVCLRCKQTFQTVFANQYVSICPQCQAALDDWVEEQLEQLETKK